LGQGKKVVLLPISLTPQELQIFSFSMALAEAGLCFIYLYVSGKGANAPPGQAASQGGGRINASGVVKSFGLVIIIV
jgi:hypothetical protein